jgi:hypothetical protein
LPSVPGEPPPSALDCRQGFFWTQSNQVVLFQEPVNNFTLEDSGMDGLSEDDFKGSSDYVNDIRKKINICMYSSGKKEQNQQG